MTGYCQLGGMKHDRRTSGCGAFRDPLQEQSVCHVTSKVGRTQPTTPCNATSPLSSPRWSWRFQPHPPPPKHHCQSPTSSLSLPMISAGGTLAGRIRKSGRRTWTASRMAGVKLMRHYVAPVCSPTRVALMTGRYWSRFGCNDALPSELDSKARAMPPGTETIASSLKAAGYRTALVGKWHLGAAPESGPEKSGFDHFYGLRVGGMTPLTHKWLNLGESVLWRNDQGIEEEGPRHRSARAGIRPVDRRFGKQGSLLPLSGLHLAACAAAGTRSAGWTSTRRARRTWPTNSTGRRFRTWMRRSAR
jgi:hypothetical protein